MTTAVSLEQVAALAAKLSLADRLRLIEAIAHDLVTPSASPEGEPPRRRSWREIRGIVAYPMCGEDAQEWVSRTRREGDEQREKALRRRP
jgi:hypothetical protein